MAVAMNRPMSLAVRTHQADRAYWPISSVRSLASVVRPPSAHAPHLGQHLDFTLYRGTYPSMAAASCAR